MVDAIERVRKIGTELRTELLIATCNNIVRLFDGGESTSSGLLN